MKPKIGIVDVGGGFRGVYAAGVLDYCMRKRVIAPDDTCGLHTLCRDDFKMRLLYGKGYVNAEKIPPFHFCDAVK